jgi:hypothetical protein
MSFFTLKKRCPFCGSELQNNNCPNEECINHKSENPENSKEKENAGNE